MSHELSRRRLLHMALGALLAGPACRDRDLPGPVERGPASHSLPSVPISAIDAHGHYGAYRRGNALIDAMMSADAADVVERARAANTVWTIASPIEGLIPPGQADPVAANEEAARVIGETPGMLQWVILDPRRPRTYDQAADMLEAPFCVGVKIHPEEHEYPIAEHGGALFEFAARHGCLVLIHSGGARSKPEEIVPFVDQVPEIACILAHLGNSWDDDPGHQVRAIQGSRHDNVYVDTSSARSVFAGLIEWAVGEIGSERIVFGTDAPLYDAPAQRARIDHARIGETDKRNILRDNMTRLLRQVAGLDVTTARATEHDDLASVPSRVAGSTTRT